MLNQHFYYSDMPVISSPVQRSLQITILRKHTRAALFLTPRRGITAWRCFCLLCSRRHFVVVTGR
jgi:hypothetical protein